MVLVACLKLFKFKRLPEPGVVICGSRAKPGAVTGRHSVFGGNGPPKGEGGVQVMSFWAGGGFGGVERHTRHFESPVASEVN